MLRFTAKGKIQVWNGTVLVSSHTQEREAYERISGLPPGKYTVTFPVIEVTSSASYQRVYETSSELGRAEARGMAVQVVRQLSDTTPPAVPSGFSASAATATSVTLTLTANVESDFSNYVLERSSDNIGWGYLKSFTGTSTTDTVDISGSTYYYRAFSIDTRGNRSAYTAVKSAGPYTVNFAWNGTVPNVTFTRGNAQNFDLSSYIIGSYPTITVETGTLPSGVTLNSAQQRLQYDGSSATSTSIVATGISLRLSTSAEADWQSRISSSGVIWYHNFESVNEVNRFRWTNGFSGGSDPNDASSRAGTVAWDSTGGVGGGGCLLITRRANAESSDWWRMFSPLDGASNGRGVDDPAAGGTIPLRTFSPTSGGSQFSDWTGGYIGHPNYANAEPTNFISSPGFYLQMRVKMDPRRTIAGNTQVGKLLFHTITRVSNVNQEIVTYSGSFPVSGSGQPNYFRMYGGNGTANPIEDQEPRPGQQPNSDLANYAAGQYCDVSNAALRGYCWSWSGGWDTIMYYIRPGREGVSGDAFIQVYAAHEGETSYTKIWEQTFTNVYSSVVDQYRRYGYNAIQASVYQNGAAQASEFWHKYAQIILSTQSIPCPQV